MENERCYTDGLDQRDRKPHIQLLPYASSFSDPKQRTNRKYFNAYTPPAVISTEKGSEFQTYSTSSTSGYSESFTSETATSTESATDAEDNNVSQRNGSVTLSLMGAKLWNRFFETGTEMIINKTGRYQ